VPSALWQTSLPRAVDPLPPNGAPEVHNLAGGAWLIADMTFNICALSIVKWLGPDYPAVQLVFLRACVGFILMLPWLLQRRMEFIGLTDLRLHMARILFSTMALFSSFYALSRLPFALVTAIGFTRPILTMVLAWLLLKETVSNNRWAAAGVAFLGVLLALQPGTLVWSSGIPAAFLTVLCGTMAIIVTRRLAGTPVVVMMTFYTLGLTLFSAPFALAQWVTIAPDHLLPLLTIGVAAQVAQFCFLKAHYKAEAGFLSILAYLSLVFTTTVGIVVFDEVPTLMFCAGAMLIVGAAIWTTFSAR